MAKKKVTVSEDSPFAGLEDLFKDNKLSPIKFGSDDDMVGIAVPSLAFQYLIGTTSLPLSRSFQLAGAGGSYKSTFMYEIMRWYIDSGGCVFLVETEAKDSAQIRIEVMMHDPNRLNRIAFQTSVVFQQWMSSVNRVYEHFTEKMSSTGVYYPLLVCVDSITAVATEESIEDIKKDGFVKPGFPSLAKHLSENFKNMSENLYDYPFSFLFTNHKKPGTATTPYSRGNLPGGQALNFYSSLILVLSSSSPVVSADGSMRTKIKMVSWKNSNGRDNMSIDVDLVRWAVPDPTAEGEHVDYVAFDWAGSDIQFLLKFGDDQKNGADMRKAVKSVIGLHAAKVGTKNGVYSEVLGIPKEAPVTYTEAGMKLHSNPALMAQLQNVLLIKKLPAYSTAVDYRKLREATIEESRNKIQRLAHNVTAPPEDSGLVDSDEFEVEDDFNSGDE